MAERTGVAGLACTLAKELARHVRGIWVTMLAPDDDISREKEERINCFRCEKTTRRRRGVEKGELTGRAPRAFKSCGWHAGVSLAVGDVEAARSRMTIVGHRGPLGGGFVTRRSVSYARYRWEARDV